jgi:hypothetical protein
VNVAKKNNLIKILVFILIIAGICFGLYKRNTIFKSKAEPEEIAKLYLDAINNGDFENAKKFATEDSKSMLDFLKQIYALSPDSTEVNEKTVIKDLKCSITEGDTLAVCSYLENDEEKRLDMKNVNGNWLVHEPKENPQNEVDSEEQYMDTDTLRKSSNEADSEEEYMNTDTLEYSL